MCLLTAMGKTLPMPENSSSDPTQKAASDQYKLWDILQSLSTLKVSMYLKMKKCLQIKEV